MKKSISYLIILFACVNSAIAATSGNLRDTVSLKSIFRDHKLIDNPKAFKILSPNSISLTAGKETDFYTFIDGRYYTNNAPKFLFTPDSNFIFTARLKPDFKETYDGGGILIYADGENWAKLLFENNDGNKPGLGTSVVKNKMTDDSYSDEIKNKDVYVKIAKAGNVFCFYSSFDGKAWNLNRTFSFPKTATMRIGFYSQSPKGSECTVEFSDITYRAKAFKNFFTGE